MLRAPRVSFGLLALILLVSMAGSLGRKAGAEVIYDNTSRYLNQSFNERREYGDQVDLEGTARRLTQLLFEYYGRFEPDGDEAVKVRIYTNEKRYDLYRNLPTTLLFESAWMPIQPGFNTGGLLGLNVLLPLHTVTVTFEFDGLGENEGAGLLFYDPPRVGYSFNEIWLKGVSGNWVPVLYSTSDPMKRANAGLRLIAERDVQLDQYQPDAVEQLAMRHGTNRIRLAQTFIPEISGRLDQVKVGAAFTNNPVTVRIIDTVGEAPGPNVLGSLRMLSGTGDLQSVLFINRQVYLKAGTRYAIELSTTAEPAMTPSYLVPVTTNAYGRGDLWVRNEVSGSWMRATRNNDAVTFLDMAFETHLSEAEPVAQIINLTSGTNFDLNEPIPIQARYRPPDIGAITQVRFFAGTLEIGVKTNAPYEFLWTNAPVGEHSLRVIAEDTFRRPFRSERARVFVLPEGRPENDDFRKRLELYGTAPSATKPVKLGTVEVGEPRPAPGYSGRTVWWSWTAYDSSAVVMSAKNSSAPDTSVAVYRGDVLDKLVLVTNGIPEVRFVPEPGRTYAIVAEPKSSGQFVTLDVATTDIGIHGVVPAVLRATDEARVTLTGSAARTITNVQLFAGTELIASTNKAPAVLTNRFQENGVFNLTLVATDDRGVQTVSAPFQISVRPTNDDLQDAARLVGFTAGADFSSVEATMQMIDPVWFQGGNYSIWYAWEAPAEGLCTLETSGRTGMGVLGAYVLPSGPGLAVPRRIAERQGETIGELEFYATAGETYYIYIAAGQPEVGRLNLHLRPLNDEFDKRGILRGESDRIVFRTRGGSVELDEPALPQSGRTNLSSLWWTWTAPRTGEARVENNSGELTAISVFRGMTPGGLQLIAENAEGIGATFQAEEGTVYQIRVIGAADEPGEIELLLAMPGLRILRPVNQQIFVAPTAIVLQGEFTGGAEEREIEFLASGVVITNLQANGMEYLWTNPPAGQIELRARTGDGGQLSAPVSIVVDTNRGQLEEGIFAGPYSRASLVVNASGELRVFGARPNEMGTTEHQDPFHPSLVFSPVTAHAWEDLQGTPSEVYALSRNGELFRNGARVAFPKGVESWSDVAGAASGFIAVGSNGELYVNGNRLIPRAPSIEGWLTVSILRDGTLGLSSDGEIYVIDPENGSILRKVSRPAAVNRWTRLEGGANVALIQGDNGEPYTLSLEYMGLPATMVTWRSKPAGVSSWRTFAAGGEHQLYLGEEGDLYGSGRNLEGQLGFGGTSVSEQMVKVPFPEGVTRWTHIAAGEKHSMAIGDDCRLYVWGSNAEGQLGLGRHFAERLVPTPVESAGPFCPAPIRVREVSAGPAGEIVLRFESVLNRQIRVEYSNDLAEWKRWNEVAWGEGRELRIIDAGPPQSERHPREERARFYRAVME